MSLDTTYHRLILNNIWSYLRKLLRVRCLPETPLRMRATQESYWSGASSTVIIHLLSINQF